MDYDFDDEKYEFRKFIREVLRDGYSRFIDLYYPSPLKTAQDPKILEIWKNPLSTERGREMVKAHWGHRTKQVTNWIGEIMIHAGEGGEHGFRYINVTEERPDFSCTNHVLLGGCRAAGLNDQDWHRRWHQLSGGRAYDRVLNDQVGGLLKHFVMTVRCPIELGDADSSAIYEANRFFLWKPREQWLEEKNSER